MAGDLPAQALDSIGAATARDEEMFSRISDVTRADDGTIFVLDQWANQLRWYDIEGRPQGHTGREGQGPGEFREPVAISIGDDDRVHVLDLGNARIATYLREGTALRFERVTRIPGSATDFCAGAGSFALLTPSSDRIITRIDESGTVAGSFGERLRASARVARDFGNEPLRELSDGQIACAGDRLLYASRRAGEVRSYDAGTLVWAAELTNFFPPNMKQYGSTCCVYTFNTESGTNEQVTGLTLAPDGSAWVSIFVTGKIGEQVYTTSRTHVLSAGSGAELDELPFDMTVTGLHEGQPYGYVLAPFSKVYFFR